MIRHLRLHIINQQQRLVQDEEDELRDRIEELRERWFELEYERKAEQKRLHDEVFAGA